MAHEVFISYATADRPVAEELGKHLEADGIDCWIAARNIPAGVKWPDRIVAAIRSARVVVVVLSSATNKAEWVPDELALAKHCKIPIVGFRIEQVEESDSLKLFMIRRQCHDACTPPLEAHIRRLIPSVRFLIQGGETLTDPSDSDSLRAIPPPSLMALLVTGIARSEELRRRLGDGAFGKLAARHDEIFVALLSGLKSASLLQDTGDGFIATFHSATEAVTGALDFQRALASEPWQGFSPRVKIGIHVGEFVSQTASVVGQRKIASTAVDVARRIKDLAVAGQVLMTRTAFDSARQQSVVLSPTSAAAASLEWLAHGPYVFSPSNEKIEIFEVGERGAAPLTPPPDTSIASRSVKPLEEDTFGWRPAVGLGVPTRPHWILDLKLGEGGFGEVWRASSDQTRQQRVFKFCFDPPRVESLKRELGLLRMLHQALGERPDIATVHEAHFDEPPYFLETSYTEAGDLVEWAKTQGGLAGIPIATRLDLVARTADTVAAAHFVGVLHKDIKPSNILIYHEDGLPRPRLADFGIGLVFDPTELERRNITVMPAGTVLPDRTGTGPYMPPECVAGKPFTVQGDVYALGILLFQMVVGDFERPLGMGWERDVADPILREDIAACVDQDPDRRLRRAATLAERLRSLDVRRTRARRRTFMRAGLALTAAGTVLAGALAVHATRVARERDRANREAQTANRVIEFLEGLFEVSNPSQARGNQITARQLLDEGLTGIDALAEEPRVQARLMGTMGNVYRALGLYTSGRPLLEKAVAIDRRFEADNPLELAKDLNNLGSLFAAGLRDDTRALELYQEALQIRERLLGPLDPDVATSLMNVGNVLRRAKKFDEAQACLDRSLAIREQAFGKDALEVAPSLTGLAALYVARKDHAAAIPLYERSLALRQRWLPADHPDVALGQQLLATALVATGEYRRAQPLFEHALATYEKVLGPHHENVRTCAFALAYVLRKSGAHAKARPLYARALAIDESLFGTDSTYVAQTLVGFADSLREEGRTAEADALKRRAQAIEAAQPAKP